MLTNAMLLVTGYKPCATFMCSVSIMVILDKVQHNAEQILASNHSKGFKLLLMLYAGID